MRKRWETRECDAERVAGLAGFPPFHPLIARILAVRGIASPEEAAGFLAPSLSAIHDPFLMRGMEAAVARLLAARHSRERVCIYGDYDVDGITGTALLVSFLRAVGVECGYFIPNRFDDGYGLGRDAIDRIAADGADLIISVDCGITAVGEALYCRQRGIDLVIVDHHTPASTIPAAHAVLNPLQPGCCYPFKSLAGVGVAFNLLIALRAVLRDEGAFGAENGPDLREWLDLVALGTIADVVPLTGQNRIYAFHGLRQLACSTRPGIRALKQVAGVAGEVSSGQVGFRLAPRLNAAGRMESAVPGVELLLSTCAEESAAIAGGLDSANAERQTVERRIFEEALTMVESSGAYPQRRSIVLASRTWHQGVVGIVASRLVERFHRPTILLALNDDGSAKGSGRSIPGFHLLDALSACAPHLERFGGHRHAAGVTLPADRVTAFGEAFEAEAGRRLSDADLRPLLEIDAEAGPEEVTRELALELKRLAPFGAANPEPVLVMRTMKILERRTVGEGHLRLRLAKGRHSFHAIAFRMGQREMEDVVDVAFFPEINEWNGTSTLQLRVKDLRPAEPCHAT